MGIINEQALMICIRDAVREELQEHFKANHSAQHGRSGENLLSKQELATELDVSLTTLSDWMKRGLPFLRLRRRVYFRKSEVLTIMQKLSQVQPEGGQA